MFYLATLERPFGGAMVKRLEEMPDGELALAWRAGDGLALRVLIERHHGAALGLALRLCGNRDRAEDLAQEALVRALSRLHQYDPAQPFRPWLFRILGHLYIDNLRTTHEFLDDPPDPPRPVTDPAGDLFIQAVLGTLSPAHRAILVLRELVGLDYAELADRLRVPIGTVRSRLSNARAAFKTAYLRLGGEEVVR